ncbi:uncharacterized protein BP5553_07562 [Venustampulla echinocandica]|uniref:Uncharacterized protein n=1 Tax=Venustampulla echinocandica TaxID=2656787 RepID=A0A370TGW4_9HELO|nr:uncharacterized protein BP5553_07562 [Venustampulla echinocandica]RDL34434.1 hypothetical protein BP5553_07562 [Venustampulla echinocandica]
MEFNVEGNPRAPSIANQDPMALKSILNPVIKDEANPSEANSSEAGSFDESINRLAISINFQTTQDNSRARDGQSYQLSRYVSLNDHMPRRVHSQIGHRHPRCLHDARSLSRRCQIRRERSPTDRRPRGPNANKEYTREQTDWIRYMKEDCNVGWKFHASKFAQQFPDVRETNQGFSSRYYRDNTVPRPDENWNTIIGKDGKAELIIASVRSRSTPEGRALDIPYTLIEKHPERALQYSWVSEEHKAEARRIELGLASKGNKAKWRALIRRVEAEGL